MGPPSVPMSVRNSEDQSVFDARASSSFRPRIATTIFRREIRAAETTIVNNVKRKPIPKVITIDCGVKVV